MGFIETAAMFDVCIQKIFVQAFSDSLRSELSGSGVRVLGIQSCTLQGVAKTLASKLNT